MNLCLLDNVFELSVEDVECMYIHRFKEVKFIRIRM